MFSSSQHRVQWIKANKAKNAAWHRLCHTAAANQRYINQHGLSAWLNK